MKDAAAVWVPVDELKPWAGNPRRNAAAVAEVARAIQRFGWGAPIVANERTGEIIAGHTRWGAAKKLGLEQVPVRWLDLSLAEARAMALADNRLGEIATWDEAGLADVLREIKAADESLLADLGFADSELRALLDDIDPSDVKWKPVDENPPDESTDGIQCPHCKLFFTL